MPIRCVCWCRFSSLWPDYSSTHTLWLHTCTMLMIVPTVDVTIIVCVCECAREVTKNRYVTEKISALDALHCIGIHIHTCTYTWNLQRHSAWWLVWYKVKLNLKTLCFCSQLAVWFVWIKFIWWLSRLLWDTHTHTHFHSVHPSVRQIVSPFAYVFLTLSTIFPPS